MPQDPNAVHRLIDMIVEEVSLVDRAANKHRFLVVKRSKPMDDNEPHIPTPDTPIDPDADEVEGPIDLNDLPEDEEGTEWWDEPGPEHKNVDATGLQIATEALEALTEAVEKLGTLSGEGPQSPVAELAQTLQSFVTRLETASGEGKTASAPRALSEEGRVDAVLASVRSVLERVGRRIAVLEATTKHPESQNQTQDDHKTSGGSAMDAFRKLDAVMAKLQELGKTVKAQDDRMAQMEKRFGLPNSTPVDAPRHATPPKASEDIGWPLDLNCAFDRESVDKAVSFHDL